MPALVNISVGSLRGTSGDDATTWWSLRAKKSMKPLRISLTPLIAFWPLPSFLAADGAKSPSGLMFRGLFSDGGAGVQEGALPSPCGRRWRERSDEPDGVLRASPHPPLGCASGTLPAARRRIVKRRRPRPRWRPLYAAGCRRGRYARRVSETQAANLRSFAGRLARSWPWSCSTLDFAFAVVSGVVPILGWRTSLWLALSRSCAFQAWGERSPSP